jgi:hypothetical protein
MGHAVSNELALPPSLRSIFWLVGPRQTSYAAAKLFLSAANLEANESLDLCAQRGSARMNHAFFPAPRSPNLLQTHC